MISIPMLDKLTEEEISIFYKIVEEEKNYRTICSELKMHAYDLSPIVKRICSKLDIYPRKPQQLRIIWRYSVRINKQQIDVKKQKALVLARLSECETKNN